jgi:hypothetical protein
MVYKYECNAMRKGSSFLPHSSVQLSASAESRQQSVCVCRRAQLFFYLGAKERERKVTRLLTWPLIAGTNSLDTYLEIKHVFVKLEKIKVY